MIKIENISFSYKDRKALHNISFEVGHGETFGLLGPNGSGKTTLFRILSTAMAFKSGSVRMLGFDLAKDYARIRNKLGIVFQSPSLDGKLTVQENMTAQGKLYGLSRKVLKDRVQEMLGRLGIDKRVRDKVDELSGGLKRRVELAKGLLHQPELLILDEPSTGLDPGARSDLWKYLRCLRDEKDVTILVTTHLMEEAEHCDRIAILNQGELVALDKPENLKTQVSEEVLVIQTQNPQDLAHEIKSRHSDLQIQIEAGALHLEYSGNHALIAGIMDQFGKQIESMTVRKPTLEDVFIHHTGHQFWQDSALSGKKQESTGIHS